MNSYRLNCYVSPVPPLCFHCPALERWLKPSTTSNKLQSQLETKSNYSIFLPNNTWY